MAYSIYYNTNGWNSIYLNQVTPLRSLYTCNEKGSFRTQSIQKKLRDKRLINYLFDKSEWLTKVLFPTYYRKLILLNRKSRHIDKYSINNDYALTTKTTI